MFKIWHHFFIVIKKNGETMMKFYLITTLTFLSLTVSSQEQTFCGGNQELLISEEKALEKEMCLDPHHVICEKNDNLKNYESRSKKILKEIREKIKRKIFDEFKDDLTSCGITDFNNFDVNTLKETRIQQSAHVGPCLLNIDPENPYNNLGIIDQMKQRLEIDYEIEIENEIKSRIPIAKEAFEIIKEKLISVMKKELKSKLIKDDLENQIEKLNDTIPLFLVDYQSLRKQFPQASINEIQKIMSGYSQTCGYLTLSLNNAYYAKYKIENKETDFMIICSGTVLSGMEESQTLRSMIEAFAMVVSHELGHQISMNINDDKTFDHYNDCLIKNISHKEIKSSHFQYNKEAQADFWAKRVVGEFLKDMSDSSVEDKIIFMRESSLILCGGMDEGIHHSAKLRINKTFRYTAEYREAFNCSAYSDQMRIREPIDCGLEGEKAFMVPEL